MATVITSIQFKRGDKATLEARLVQGDLGVPLRGEPIWETDTNRIKIGNGSDPYVNLDYFSSDTIDNLVLEGYYDQASGFFYDKPAQYVDRKRLPEWSNRLYRDMETNDVYYFKAVGRFTKLIVSTKLYSSSGQNIDGAMTQKAVTDGINGIDFNLDTIDTECLILKKPW